MSSLGKIEQRYQISNPPCKRCDECKTQPVCRAYANKGTVFTLILDRASGQNPAVAELNSAVYDRFELLLRTDTAVTQMVRHNEISTMCPTDQLVKLQPYK
jgi:hypothetical protein